MNIAFFSDTTYPQPNGVAYHLYELSKELEKRAHLLKIYSPKIKGQTNSKRISYEPLPYISIPKKLFKHEAGIAIPYLSKTINDLKRFKPDIVHVQTPFGAGLAGRFLARKLNIPLVESFHGYIMDPGYLKVIKLGWANKVLDNFIWKLIITGLNKADLTITPSVFAKKDLVSHGLKTKIESIPNAVDFKQIDKIRRSSIAQKSINQYGYLVLYVGRVSWEKNLDTLIKSFKLIQENLPSSKLLIIGDGPAKSYLENYSNNMGVSDNVDFLGFKKRDEIYKKYYLQSNSVFVTTSKSENQPMSIIEAMHFSIPIVAVKSRGLKELIKDCGILCKPDNPAEIAKEVITIFKNEKLRDKLSKKSYNISKKYSIKNSVDSFEKSYKNLLKNEKK